MDPSIKTHDYFCIMIYFLNSTDMHRYVKLEAYIKVLPIDG